MIGEWIYRNMGGLHICQTFFQKPFKIRTKFRVVSIPFRVNEESVE